MWRYDVPNITWPELTGPDPDMQHPPYPVETLKRAITQGLDPGGNPLEYTMPRWQMSEQDLNDPVSFIKILK
jgi:cytochrome c oxidase subunit 2